MNYGNECNNFKKEKEIIYDINTNARDLDLHSYQSLE